MQHEAFRGWTWEPATVLDWQDHPGLGRRALVQFADGAQRWQHETFVREADAA